MSAIISFIAENAYAWGKRMMYLAIIVAIWQIFVSPYIDNAQIVMMWWLNETVFKVLTEAAINMILQVLIFAVTFKILFWFFSSPQREPHEIEHAAGFTSRRL